MESEHVCPKVVCAFISSLKLLRTRKIVAVSSEWHLYLVKKSDLGL
jgi:hypothetical protein